MQGFFTRSLILLLTAFSSTAIQADVRLPNVFTNSMVLQRGQLNPVWGKADPGESVTVHIGEQRKSATADEQGNWKVNLDPMQVGKPLELVVQGKNEIRITDVLVGEVWICSGQSNMQWSVNASNNVALEKASANYPQIRMINFPQVGVQEPIWSHDDRKWMVCNPQNVGGFSAVGYFFARQLHQTLGVPVGMINNAWGGSACEAMARQPEVAGRIQTAMIISAALIEGAAFFALIICFAK